MAKPHTGGVYANMDFPPYVYQPYPRHVPTGPHGKYEVANSEAEEAAILGKLQKDQDDAPAVMAPHVADPEKEILISRARELGVPFNSKWSKMKLQLLVNEAEAAVDDLPPEEEPTKRKGKSVEDVEEGLKDHLIEQAKALGIPANKLWGIPRLRSSISEAKKEQE